MFQAGERVHSRAGLAVGNQVPPVCPQEQPAGIDFIVYVTDIERATNFYRDLFEIEPVMITPRYVPFEVVPGVVFALSNRGGEQAGPKTPRSAVVGLMVPRTEAAVDDVFAAWTAKGVTVAEEPHDEIYGRTFNITDPDGNSICVTPVD